MAVESVDAAECGYYHLHRAHSWRGGFLWRKKKTCRGTSFPSGPSDLPEDFVPPSASLVPLTIVEHKHDFKLAEGIEAPNGYFLRKPEEDLLWVCDWNDCNHVFVTARDLWQEQGVPYNVY
jgi:hypothetical protein